MAEIRAASESGSPGREREKPVRSGKKESQEKEEKPRGDEKTKKNRIVFKRMIKQGRNGKWFSPRGLLELNPNVSESKSEGKRAHGGEKK